MAGHHHVQHAWSPSGGWFFTPKNWKANTTYIGIGLLGVSILTYALGEKLTIDASRAYDDETIARWNAAAKKARESKAISEVTGEK